MVLAVLLYVSAHLGSQSFWVLMLFFTLSGFFLFMTLPLITVMYTAILPRTQAIAAIAFSGGIANLFGGFFGPMLVGWMKTRTGDFSLAFSVLALFGLIGGAILNLMPCVLPVIPLKLFSFVEQAGKNRSYVLALNIAHAAGIFIVFMALAVLFAQFNHDWGERSTAFNIGMTAFVFMMALSFLGVWEIPIPGFVGAGKGAELAASARH